MNDNFNEKRYSKEMILKGNDKIRIDFILSNIKDDNCEILDLGCWDGAYAKLYFKKTNKVYGIESSVTSAEEARKNGIIVEQGCFPDDKFFINKKFDYIVAGEIIEHVFDTDLFLQTIHDKLKENGTLILTTPNVASLPRRIMLLLGINPHLDFRSKGDVAGHIRYFTFNNLKNLLKENNFKITKEESDILSFNNKGTMYSKLIPKLHKEFGKTIMICAKKL